MPLDAVVSRNGASEPFSVFVVDRFAQIAGLAVATVAGLVLTPSIYGLLVRDLRWLAWSEPPEARGGKQAGPRGRLLQPGTVPPTPWGDEP